ncbi:unnamed protein product, partial [Meganyctiphanes norvegica]
GQYVTLAILKNLKNGENVIINSIVSGNISINIHSETFDKKFYFKAQKELSVHYYRDDGKSQIQTLQHLKQRGFSVTLPEEVNYLALKEVHEFIQGTHYYLSKVETDRHIGKSPKPFEYTFRCSI